MKLRKSQSGISVVLALVVAVLFSASPTLSAELLHIQPVKYDTGTVDEGTPAAMRATVENISDKEVRVSSVKTN